MMKHKHHIVPIHAGGTDDPSNLIELSVEEHALAHKNLWEEHGREEDRVAWLGLSNQIGKQEIHALIMKCPTVRQKISEGRTGLRHSAETRKKISDGNRGRIYSQKTLDKMSKSHSNISQETREKMSASKKGKIIPDEVRAKISAARKGQTPWNKGLNGVLT
jgi:NUMOD3 motif